MIVDVYVIDLHTILRDVGIHRANSSIPGTLANWTKGLESISLGIPWKPTQASCVVGLTGITFEGFLRRLFVIILGISFVFETLQQVVSLTSRGQQAQCGIFYWRII